MLKSMQKAIDYIEDNIYDELQLENIAEQVYMSPFHFSRLFSIVCGMNVGEYIRNRRLSLAGIEIETTTNKIIDIALKYQYESPESFSRAFTRFHGLSPMAARSQRGQIKSMAKISVEYIIGGKSVMQKLKERGYAVKENGTVYYTTDMDNTAKWFEEVLGWYANIDQRNDSGQGMYGCVLPFPFEVSSMTLAPFSGIHMFYGEASDKMVAFMRIDNVENLYTYVKRNGWNQISEITHQPWGGKECRVTTIDGSILRFFQLDE